MYIVHRTLLNVMMQNVIFRASESLFSVTKANLVHTLLPVNVMEI